VAPESADRTINSPMVGTFYRSPSPEAPSFVQVGSEVEEETVVCILEAMKVMNEIKAGHRAESWKRWWRTGSRSSTVNRSFDMRLLSSDSRYLPAGDRTPDIPSAP